MADMLDDLRRRGTTVHLKPLTSVDVASLVVSAGVALDAADLVDCGAAVVCLSSSSSRSELRQPEVRRSSQISDQETAHRQGSQRSAGRPSRYSMQSRCSGAALTRH